MKLTFNTPQGRIFSGDVTSLTVPGSEEKGSFQILHNHAPVISSLQKGTVTMLLEDKSTQVYHIEGGFIEVSNNVISLLAESAELQ